jgi:dihydrofolate synthase/folylpolyglutamate synthase
VEKVREDPPLVLDVAHNEIAMKTSLEAVRTFYPHERLLALAGFSEDKDWARALLPLVSSSARLFLTTAGGARAARPEALTEAARAAGARDATCEPVLEDAVDALLEACGPGDLALITGSFYVTGRACRHLGVDAG